MKINILTNSVLIALIIMFLNVSCTPDTETHRISELEERIAELEKQTKANMSPTQTLEMDIPDVLGTVGNPQWKEKQTLYFSLKVGDKVEGAVIVTGGKGNGLISTVRDPYGNILYQSATKTNYVYYESLERGKATMTYLSSIQDYPWRFSFLGSATGDYSLDVYNGSTGMSSTTGTSVHFTVNIN